MKKCVIITISFFISIILYAQEPSNNLRKTISELKQSFPDLVIWGSEINGVQNYKSPESNILFETKKGIVVTEFTVFYGTDSYLLDLYQTLINSFLRNAKGSLRGRDNKSISIFYSYFYIHISYTPFDSVSLSYNLNSQV